MARQPRQPQTRINRRIRFPQVRVIGSDGSQLGVMATRDALKIAEEEGYDLVEISPDARPPVCRILDYGKHQYDASKSAKKAKKKQTGSQLKEMRYRPKIDEHDIKFKTARLREFLIEGHKVRAYVEFRGREMTHTEFGYRILERIKAQLEDVGQPEPSVRMEGRHMSLIINPLRGAGKQKAAPSENNKKRKRPDADAKAEKQDKGAEAKAADPARESKMAVSEAKSEDSGKTEAPPSESQPEAASKADI